ncbi:MAG: hypothetical protein AB7T37_15000 [Dehalococcoidia bacterium]
MVIEDPVTGDQCVHHWVLDKPLGNATPASCKKCGELRDFTPRPKMATWRRPPGGSGPSAPAQ